MEATAPTKIELKVDKMRSPQSGESESNDFSVESLRRYIVGYVQKI